MSELVNFDYFAAELGVREITDRDSFASFVKENAVRFSVDSDSGRKVALTRLVLSLVEFQSAYMLVLEHGVWPSSELPDLHARLRISKGIKATIADSANEKCSRDESDYIECLFFCALSFCWSTAIVFHEIPLIIYVDDDEWIGICTPDDALLSKATAEFLKFGLIEL